MDKGEKGGDKSVFAGNIFSEKNILSITEKILNSRNKQLFAVILIIGILLMTIPVGSKKTSGISETSEEKKLCKTLSEIEGCGAVSAMISYASYEKNTDDTSTAKGAVIVAEGADSTEVRNKISEAVQAVLDLPPHKVRVYKSK